MVIRHVLFMKMFAFFTEDGRLKYKVHFLEKGKSLVSGHHIAWDSMPKWEQLFVGARVVVKREADQTHFCPGVLAELPNRKNRMRCVCVYFLFVTNYLNYKF